MPISFRVAADRRLVETRIDGEVSLEEVIAHMRELEATPDYVGDFDAIIDIRHLTPTMGSNELRTLASHVRARPPDLRSRRAFVTHEDAMYGLVRMFEAYAEGSPAEYRGFRTLRQAAEWLGIDVATLRHIPLEDPTHDELQQDPSAPSPG